MREKRWNRLRKKIGLSKRIKRLYILLTRQATLFDIVLAYTYNILGSAARGLHQQKPATPRGLSEPSDNRTKDYTNARCQDPLEFNISYAPAR
jgi:hypothetical protein